VTLLLLVSPSQLHPLLSGGEYLLFLLRRLVVALAPHSLVESRRIATRNGDRGPLVSGQDAGDEDNLANVLAALSKRSLDCQRHGMRLASDRHVLAQVARRQFGQRVEQPLPAGFPIGQ
jgi:hypothetical protein